jgi:hypothetical protein
LLGLVVAEWTQAAASGLRVLADRPLPTALSGARDVRWADDESVHLGLAAEGTRLLSLETWVAREEISKGRRGGPGAWLSSRLARSGDRLVVAAPVFEIVVKDLRAGTLEKLGGFESIADVDLHVNRVAVLGTRMIGPERKLSPDGAVAWVGTLEHRLDDASALLVTPSGKGPARMDYCGGFDVGAVRYLPDGSLVIVPGAEPGVYLLDPAGKLLHTWATEPLGLDLPCEFDAETSALLALHEEQRWERLERFRIVDEILPLRDGVGLVVRSVDARGTRWKVHLLKRNGPATSFELPITTTSTMSHLRADVRDDLAVFLVAEDGPPQRPQQAAPRLVVMTLPR